jgi:hypothetical protein
MATIFGLPFQPPQSSTGDFNFQQKCRCEPIWGEAVSSVWEIAHLHSNKRSAAQCRALAF